MRSTKDNLQVLFEDNHIIAINKRSGDIVQGDKTGDTPLSDIVKAFLKEKYNKPGNVFVGVVHRLDRPTTGIVLFAKTSKALTRLNKMIADKKIKKTYWALVKKRPPKDSDRLIGYLKKNPKTNKSKSYLKEMPGSKLAILNYTIKKKTNSYFLLEIDLETGRHHQIRVQLSSIGSPIKGDLKYGFNRSNPDASISLHARFLNFIHPVSNEQIALTAPLPSDVVWEACNDA